VLKYIVVARREGTPRTVAEWRDPFAILRHKWGVVPGDVNVRVRSEELLTLGDDELLRTWEGIVQRDTEGQGFAVRGWFHTLYRSLVRVAKILDFCCCLWM
jgi:hypothetical protein